MVSDYLHATCHTRERWLSFKMIRVVNLKNHTYICQK